MSAAIVVAASAAAVAANRQAARAYMGVIDAYDAAEASVAQMQTYEACVQRLYPGELDVNPLILKATVLFLLLTMILGIVAPSTGRSWDDRALCGVVYPLAGAFAIIVGILVIWGIKFLVS